MKRDFLDELLRRKLEDYREEPPGDGWSRIEAGLSGIRPRRAVRWIRYAVAASLLAGALTTGVYLANRGQTPLAVSRSAAEPEIFTPHIPDRHTSAESAMRPSGAFRLVATERVREVDPQAAREITPAAAPEIAPEVQSVRTDPPQEESRGEERPAGRKETETTGQTNVDWYRTAERNETPKKRRKNGRGVSVSLYAANFSSGNQQSATPQNTLSMMSSDMSSSNTQKAAGVFSARAAKQDQVWDHHTPVTFGAAVSFRVAPRTALETGLIFTRLRSTSEMQAIASYRIDQRLDYVGIPISATYTFLDSRYATFYGRAGGTLEYCVSGQQVTSVQPGSVSDHRAVEKIDVKGLQTSVGAGIGGMFNITPHVGVYLEPGVSLYLEREDQPESYRTAHPLTFDLRAGLRFRFR